MIQFYMLSILVLCGARVRAEERYRWLTIGMLLAGRLEWIRAFEIEYYDCSQPFEVHTYDRKSLCKMPESEFDQQKTQTWQIMQERTSGMMEAHTCTVQRSVLEGLCGVWGHFKLINAPSILKPLRISQDRCAQMVRTKRFQTEKNPEGYELTENHIVEFTEKAVGTIYFGNGLVNCYGESKNSYRGEHMSDVVEMHSYSVLIQKTRLLTQGQNVEDIDNQVKLECKSTQGYCVTGSRTYLWKPELNACKLAQVKTVQAKRVEKDHLLSTENKMMLSLQKPYMSEAYKISGFRTNFEGIIAAKIPKPTVEVRLDPHDVDRDLDWASALSYVEYQMNRKTHGKFSELQKLTCQASMSQLTQGPTRVAGNQFMLLRGDSYLHFKCKSKKSLIARLESCFNQVPLKSGGFVDPVNRIWSEHSEPVLCSKYFPLIIQVDDHWLEMPSLKSRPAPAGYPHGRVESTGIEDFSPDVLYSKAELKEFRELLAFPSYKQARETEILLGECRHKGHCELESREGGGSAVFDLDQLRPSVIEEMDPRSWLKKVEVFMETSGGYFSLVALVIFAGQTLMYVKLLISESTMMVWIRLLWPGGVCRGRCPEGDVATDHWARFRRPPGGTSGDQDERYEMLLQARGTGNMEARGENLPQMSGGKSGDADPILAV